MADITIIMGSSSDCETIVPCMEVLKKLDISYTVKISSAHRTPERTATIIKEAEASGTKIFICAAGMAAHLAGAVAARTIKPVIGIPILGKALAGMDALFSTIQMPAGFPVATVAINGAKNAAWLAIQILALENDVLRQKLINSRDKMRAEVEAASAQFEENS